MQQRIWRQAVSSAATHRVNVYKQNQGFLSTEACVLSYYRVEKTAKEATSQTCSFLCPIDPVLNINITAIISFNYSGERYIITENIP